MQITAFIIKAIFSGNVNIWSIFTLSLILFFFIRKELQLMFFKLNFTHLKK